MRILLHDYSGHGFAVQMSRWLAAQGHDVLHLWSRDISSPKGPLGPSSDDPETFHIEALGTGAPIPKYALIRRRFREKAYGRALAKRCRAFAPDIVICGNTPPEIADLARRAVAGTETAFLFWVQDIYHLAVERRLRDLFGGLASLPGWWFRRIESKVLQGSDGILAISDDFLPLLMDLGAPPERCAVLPNWAPLADFPQKPKDNQWAKSHGFDQSFMFVYSGTLGMKHDPTLLAELAGHMPGDMPDARLLVISEGPGRNYLEQVKAQHGLERLTLLDFQHHNVMSEVLGSANVLIAILEPFAGKLSVPSKILSYLCAGRPVLGALPLENLAARTLEDSGAGLVVEPGERAAFLQAAKELYDNRDRCAEMGRNGRASAEQLFDIDRVGGIFFAAVQRAVDWRLRQQKKPG